MGALRTLNTIIRPLGLEVRRAPKWNQRSQAKYATGQKIYVGCGEDRRDDYLGCDVRPLASVDIVCKAWEISAHVRDTAEIYSRHMLEHLTFAEMQFALKNWFLSLAPGGKVHIIVPNMAHHIRQWQQSVWDVDSWKDNQSNAAWSAAGFYGWQRDCCPTKPGYETSYWDVHKSGYCEESIRFFLESAGFCDVQTKIEDEVHLVVEAFKPKNLQA